MYFLNGPQQHYLLLQPETGMGYQLVEITTTAKKRLVGVAYNAELVLQKDDPIQRPLFQAFALGADLSGQAKAVLEVRLLDAGSRDYRRLMVGESRAPYATEHQAAGAAPVVTTKAGEVFVRFSASAHDRRIRANGSLFPGSFVTTAADAARVHGAKEIRARYALPQPGPLGHVFTIKPAAQTLVQYGTAQPAHGQPGGGVEVIFTEGTTPHTVTGPEAPAAR